MAQLVHNGKTWEIPDADSPCQSWTIYFEELEQAFDTLEARKTWLLTWQHQGNTTCTMNAGFNEWFAGKGIDVSNAATRTIASTAAVVENVAGLSANLTGLLKKGVPVILVGAAAFIAYQVYQTVKSGNGLPLGVLKKTPAGMITKLALGK